MTERPALDRQFASEIYDILVQECGAREGGRDQFIQTETSEYCREYRFQGALGFGGKLHRDGQRLYVSCYPEDMTPERVVMLGRANSILGSL